MCLVHIKDDNERYHMLTSYAVHEKKTICHVSSQYGGSEWEKSGENLDGQTRNPMERKTAGHHIIQI